MTAINKRLTGLVALAGLLGTTALASAASAATVAGEVAFATSGVLASHEEVGQRAVIKGLDIFDGDLVRTNDGRAQMKLIDGSFFSISPGAEMVIDDLVYDPAGPQDAAFAMTLLSGAFRTVSGAIGKQNPEQYKINTPVATLGVRGTEFLVSLDDGLTVAVGDGTVTLTNETGLFEITSGQTAFVASPTSRPQIVSERPYLAPPPPAQQDADAIDAPVYQTAEDRNEEGTSVLAAYLATSLDGDHHGGDNGGDNGGDTGGGDTGGGDTGGGDTGGGDTGGGDTGGGDTGGGDTGGGDTGGGITAPLERTSNLFILYAGSHIGADERAPVDGTFNADGGLTAYDWTDSTNENPEAGTNTITEVSGNDQIAIGRWSGGTSAGSYFGNTFDFPADGGLHYVIGIPTETMPTTGTGTYSLSGATSPTFADGTATPGTFTGDLAVAFGATASVGFDFSVDMPGDAVYTLATPGGAADPSQSGVTFSNNSFSTNLTLTDAGRACDGNCMGLVKGAFMGTDATYAGVAYMIWAKGGSGSGGSADTIEGAAWFTLN